MSRRRAAPRFDDKRPPLARLESFVAETARERKSRMMRRIVIELDESAEPGPWIAAARSLEARAIISFDAVVHFTEKFLESVSFRSSTSDAEMVRLSDEMERIERSHGLTEDEHWTLDQAPPEWLVLSEAWDRRNDAIKIATLRALGHDDLADLLAKDPREFEGAGAVGYHELWGDDGEGDDDSGPRSDQTPSPVDRLESVVANAAHARADRTFHAIRIEVDQLADPSPWLAAARSLELRGLISAETAVYLSEIFLEGVSERAGESDVELLRLSDEMERVRRAHGLDEDDFWELGDEPPEYRALSDAWNRRDAAIQAAVLRAAGNDALADLMENDSEEFQRRSVEGHRQLWDEPG
jgi:hypothetical protein